VGIVGGGVAGLMCAWELAALGFEVDLYESTGELGGLASGFDFDGVSIERFYHFICRHDRTLIETCGRLGLSGRLRWRTTRTGFFYDGSMYRFGTSLDLLRFSPLSFRDKARFGLNVLYSRRFRHWPLLEDRPARDWLIEQLGPRGYSVIWDPLLRVKFGQYHEQISAAWMWHRIHRVATSRASIFHPERFAVLEGGSDTLIRALETAAATRGARIHRHARVMGIWAEGGKSRGLHLMAGERTEPIPFDYVVCAVPLPVYCRLMPGDRPEYQERLAAIRFLGVVCMILRLKRSISPYFWLNVHDPRISFNGVIEYSNLAGREAYGGRSIVYVPYYLEPSEPRYRFSDE
jgi:protoporphyrinogen oxidase